MRIVAFIPARYQSSRFPGKPLAKIYGRPMIQWVYEAVAGLGAIQDVYVATDDGRIFDTVKDFGGQAVMTGPCSCGTERIYQAGKGMDYDVAINVQGDEPMLKKQMLLELIKAFADPTVQMATLKKAIYKKEDIENPNIAKVVTDVNGDAVLFSRSPIPYNRSGMDGIYYKHIGIYGYTKMFLQKFAGMEPSCLEQAEQLEQLRAIENGYKIRVMETQHQCIGVDLPEHIAVVEKEIKRMTEMKRNQRNEG